MPDLNQQSTHPRLRKAFIPNVGSARYFLVVGAVFFTVGVVFWLSEGPSFGLTPLVLGASQIFTAGLVWRFGNQDATQERDTYDKSVLHEE